MVRISFTVRESDKKKWIEKGRELGYFSGSKGERGLSTFIKDTMNNSTNYEKSAEKFTKEEVKEELIGEMQTAFFEKMKAEYELLNQKAEESKTEPNVDYEKQFLGLMESFGNVDISQLQSSYEIDNLDVIVVTLNKLEKQKLIVSEMKGVKKTWKLSKQK
jgi:hypothetical protein